MHDGASPKIFRNASKLRMEMTEAELIVWEYLKQKRGKLKFRRQHPINAYILDFYCHQLRLAIEIDGKYHLNKEQREKDKDRTAYLNSMGIEVIRFANEMVLANFEEVVYKIDSIIADLLPFRGWGQNSTKDQSK